MWHHVDVVRLAPSSDFHRLCKTPNVGYVDSCQVDEIFLNIREPVPLAGKDLPNSEGYLGHAPQGLVRRGRLLMQWVFDEVQRTGWEAVAKRGRLRHVQHGVIVDAQDGVGADGFTQLGEPFAVTERDSLGSKIPFSRNPPIDKRRTSQPSANIALTSSIPSGWSGPETGVKHGTNGPVCSAK